MKDCGLSVTLFNCLTALITVFSLLMYSLLNGSPYSGLILRNFSYKPTRNALCLASSQRNRDRGARIFRHSQSLNELEVH